MINLFAGTDWWNLVLSILAIAWTYHMLGKAARALQHMEAEKAIRRLEFEAQHQAYLRACAEDCTNCGNCNAHHELTQIYYYKR